ncbi:MAG: hypothetical protein O3B47_00105 [bacterium]|nr:hypothetical protein [bacterium]
MTNINPQVVLICVHDGSHKEFLKNHPDLHEIFKDYAEIFESYLKLERDFAALALTREIKKLLKKEIKVASVEVTDLPRGIIDANRTPEEAIRRVFNHEEHPELVKKFMHTYETITKQALEALENLSQDGLFLDIHTMIDFSPSELVPISPGSFAMQEYIEARTNPDRLKERRLVNFLTARENQPSLAHPGLAGNLEKGFNRDKLKVSHNDPYRLLDWTMLNHYMSKYPQKGIGIDIPICELSKDGESCEINPILDPSKIARKGEIIASAILATLS